MILLKLSNISSKSLLLNKFISLPKCMRFSTELLNRHGDNLEKSIELSEKMKISDISGIRLWKNFINVQLEEAIVEEIDAKWQRLSYQKGHWDNAIQDYREIEIQSWSDQAAEVVQSMKATAFNPDDKTLPFTHILDLAPHGHIKPHVDSIRFCGRAIAGLSLLSSSVMKFINEEDKDMWFKIVLPRRSMYIMEGEARYEFSHEILKDEESFCNDVHIPKGRRISVLCRTQVESQNRPEDLFKPVVFSFD